MSEYWTVSKSSSKYRLEVRKFKDGEQVEPDVEFVEDRLSMQTPTGLSRAEVLEWFDESIEEVTKERGFAQTQEAKDMATWMLDGMRRARAAVAG